MAELEIPPRGTRGSRATVLFLRLLRPIANTMVTRYRKNAGTEPPLMFGFPTVLLTTIGAKTGLERTHVLGGFKQDADRWVVVASNSGAATHPLWFINLAKNPDKVWLEVGNRKFHVRPEELKGTEYEDAYARIAGASPAYGKYRKATDREIPLIRLTPVNP